MFNTKQLYIPVFLNFIINKMTDLKKLNGGQFCLLESSSLLWICSYTEQQKPYITILDINNPNCILEAFAIDVISDHLCIASIPGLQRH